MDLVLNPEDFSLRLSDMNPIELGRILSAMTENPKGDASYKKHDKMTTQYLKGRPFRTPNNRVGYVKLPTR